MSLIECVSLSFDSLVVSRMCWSNASMSLIECVSLSFDSLIVSRSRMQSLLR